MVNSVMPDPFVTNYIGADYSEFKRDSRSNNVRLKIGGENKSAQNQRTALSTRPPAIPRMLNLKNLLIISYC